MLFSLLAFISVFRNPVIAHVTGNSTQPYFGNNEAVLLYRDQQPNPGESFIFKCNVDKCEHKQLHKFLIYKKDNCYWVQGRKDDWFEDGKFYTSLDSRVFDALCGDEIRIIGVTKKIQTYEK